MFTLQDLLNKGLPALTTDGNDADAFTVFSRDLTPSEWLTYLSVADPSKAKTLQGKIDILDIPNWATWTQAEFATWCNNNLMSDALIDGTTLSVALKTNIKANNAFTRNGGKLLIALRDMILYLIRQI